MTNEEIIQKVADLVKSKFEGEGSGHDWWHIYRVWNNAKLIAKGENCNIFIVELGALLHDIADYKFHDGDHTIGGKVTREILTQYSLSEDLIEQVVHIVNNVSFSTSINGNQMKSIDGLIVQDADRLDAMGAIGIARCFAFGGHKNNPIYNPNEKIEKEKYGEKGRNSPSGIAHFYEKLLLLKDLMNTQTGKKIAEERHKFMENYLNQFFKEWEGEK